jgi:hypothetical protein
MLTSGQPGISYMQYDGLKMWRENEPQIKEMIRTIMDERFK